ncbi:hypothetical protein TSUD_197590 [Trifolium subterraneum]|uniref:Cullin N-terminal domain-containing protein n=1 Tax=Trifolium subterraneum TaxID=3900 RepID=A0A2Z6LG91_TRISU|nr:hypothetical protein TSUD_197590 [Trifolium subterraneum]
MSNNVRRIISLEEGLDTIQKTIIKLQNILEHFSEPHLELSTSVNSQERMNLYSIIYNMCTQKVPHDYSQQLYENYTKAFEDYIKSTVYDEMHRQAMDAILAMVFSAFHFHVI